MAESKTAKPQMLEIYEGLKNHEKVNLYGRRGVGKTRMAKKLSNRAINEGVFGFTLWVFMCREYTQDSLRMSIGRQLFLIRANEEWEVEEENNVQDDYDDQAPVDMKKLSEDIQKKINGHKTLVIIDGLPDGKTKTETETKFWSLWEQVFPSRLITTLLTSVNKREDDGYTDENAFEIKASREASYKILKENLESQSSKKAENLETRLHKKAESLGKEFIDKFEIDLPGKAILIAKALNYFCSDASRVSIIEKELSEAPKTYNLLSKLLCNMHDVLPIGVLKDFKWRGNHFYRDSGYVHYSELITYWILEGYLGDGRMTTLYQKGHNVVMQLIDCGVLKLQEGGYVFMDHLPIDVKDLYQSVDQNPNLGLATVIRSEEEGLGSITHNNGKLKTKGRKKADDKASGKDDKSPEKDDKTSGKDDKASGKDDKSSGKDDKSSDKDRATFLLDGTSFRDSEITDCIKSEKNLKVFGLFYPTITKLPLELEERERLRVLVLRGCEYLREVKGVSLKAVEVLEISGGLTLRRLNSSFFKNMFQLKSLHLSGLQMVSLPQAIYNLQNIQWLIVKDCPRLKKLESISKLGKLIVVDLSGNTSLETLDKNFLKFEKLQTLNLSKTRVPTTPLLKNRKELTHLFCRGCPELVRLRGLTALSSLQTINLSGSKFFEEFHDSSLESLTSLITLDLSETKIDRLPSNISKPRYVYIKSCPELQRLPYITSFENLEVLDLSGSTNLADIDPKFFDDMHHVRVLNLSKTGISQIPSLSNLSELRELVLSQCDKLKALPSLESATKLEILDASNCTALQEIQSKSFEGMSHLQKIDFSETKIQSFPSLPNPCNLTQLLLTNCIDLKDLVLDVQFPCLNELNLSGVKFLKPNGAEFVKDTITLRILDLSDTSIKELPSMLKLVNLTHLSLAGCKLSSETKLDNPLIKIQVLDLSRSSMINSLPVFNYEGIRKLMVKDCSIKKIPDDFISTSTRLEYIELPNLNNESSTKKVDPDQWNICKLSDNEKSPVFHNVTQFLEKTPLRNGPHHLCAVPKKVEGDQAYNTYPQKHDLVFRDVYFQSRTLAKYKKSKSLQIRGFEHFPKDIENIIKDIDLVFLIDCKLIALPYGSNTSTTLKLKGCWIERCNEMVNIFHQKEEKDNSTGFDIPLEDLGICNNKSLERIYGGNKASGTFDYLKSLYIDSCTKLITVFSSSWLPKNLEVLEIKYCDKMVELVGVLPASLRILKIWECPKVKFPEDRFEIPKDLKTLWISGATSLKNFITRNNEPANLENLKVESCPMLEYVVTSNLSFASIQVIEIRSCEKIKTLCTDKTKNKHWENLKKLHLEDLPKLKQIGADFLSTVPYTFMECPNLLNHVFNE
ncbi:putative disease resistance protein At4g19050 isoform X2 [Bidens hawaiensis]|uniref:putative disease resistance protein At4g19050 isoform X2 n=1 Tax=Bidens hawaiensis TaxID=980011 RepID=UPI00404979F1